MDEGLSVTTEAVRLAGETIEADEGLLVVLRGDGFFDLVSLLEASGKIESQRDSEKLFGRKGLFLVEKNIRRYRGADEATEAVKNKNGRRVDFGSGGVREETLDNGFGLFFEADVQEGEGFVDARGNIVLAHDFSRKIGRFGFGRPVAYRCLNTQQFPNQLFIARRSSERIDHRGHREHRGGKIYRFLSGRHFLGASARDRRGTAEKQSGGKKLPFRRDGGVIADRCARRQRLRSGCIPRGRSGAHRRWGRFAVLR